MENIKQINIYLVDGSKDYIKELEEVESCKGDVW